MDRQDWPGCYESTWHDLIAPEAFAHPAKAARGLLQRIYAHLDLPRGSVVVDPFGGIGTTAIEGAWLGMRVVCCELEPRFVALAQENFAFHARGWETLGLPQPVIVQGDSRQLRTHLDQMLADCVVSSPPYAEIASGSGGLNTTPPKDATQQSGRSASAASQDTDSRYGNADGQLAKMAKGEVDAVISSPPFLDNGANLGGTSPERGRRQELSSRNVKRDDAYGVTPGQLVAAKDATFWSAAKEIVSESYAILKPGGRAAWIVKAFVRKGQIVDFPGDWRKLCEHVGFETVLEAHALLTKSTTEIDLFGEAVTETKARKSFFRRLAEAKGAPAIDYEVVLIMVKR